MIDIKNYDTQNIFAKIIRKEIPSEKIYENESVYAFKDINPQAPIHILVVPKKNFCSFDDFTQNADDKTILEFFRSVKKIIENQKLTNGYRIISNIGSDGGQEVPHLHFHILGGKPLGRIMDPNI